MTVVTNPVEADAPAVSPVVEPEPGPTFRPDPSDPPCARRRLPWTSDVGLDAR